jgi:hypothetical protein
MDLAFGPFEIKTLAVDLGTGEAVETDLLERENPSPPGSSAPGCEDTP